MPRKKFDLSLLPPAPNLEFEQSLWRAGIFQVGGVDEAGRGALAGPVAAGVVVLPMRDDLPEALAGVRDSKLMTARARQEWAEVIPQVALAYGVGFAGPDEIDVLGIVPATHLAVRRALKSLPLDPQHLLLDGRLHPDVGIPETVLIKGDRRSLSIASAAILAKVARDEKMVELSERFPNYDFSHNKGYGTAAHCAAIEAYGPCPVHRYSFAPIRQDDSQEITL